MKKRLEYNIVVWVDREPWEDGEDPDVDFDSLVFNFKEGDVFSICQDDAGRSDKHKLTRPVNGTFKVKEIRQSIFLYYDDQREEDGKGLYQIDLLVETVKKTIHKD